MRRALLVAILASACGPKTTTSHPVAVTAAPALQMTIVAPTSGRDGWAMVTERREVELSSGDSEVLLGEVPDDVDPATVTFRSLTDPTGTRVLAQTPVWNAATPRAALEAALGAEIVARTASGEVKGTLVAADATAITVRTPQGVRIVPLDDSLRGVRIVDRPGGFVARPALRLTVHARKGGRHLVEFSYQVAGIGWRAEHQLALNGDTATLSTMVTLWNRSEHTFQGASVDLALPGTPSRDARPGRTPPTIYHLGTTDVRPGQRLVALGEPARALPVKRLLRYDGSAGIPLRNDPERLDVGYGTAMSNRTLLLEDLVVTAVNDVPAGHARIIRMDDGTATLVTEAELEATKAGEDVRFELGVAKGITAQRRRVRYHVSPRHRKFTESFEIRVRNDSGSDAHAVVVERLYRGVGWSIVDESSAHKNRGDRAVEWTVALPKGKSTRLSYAVEYHW